MRRRYSCDGLGLRNCWFPLPCYGKLEIYLAFGSFANKIGNLQPKEGIEKRLGKDVDLKYTYDDFDTDAAAELAKDADIALVFSNADSGEGYITVDGNEGDRKNLTLWKNGDNLVRR